MTSVPIPISSDDSLTDIENHFRITAGPGAGKTHWLVNHIRRVVRDSERMPPGTRIGVISYTNVAVREILARLETVADIVDVSTIHSFLFRNLVRPYLHLLKGPGGEDLVAHDLVDTHSESYVAHKQLDEWLGRYGERRLLVSSRDRILGRLKSQLRSLVVRVDSDANAYFAPRKIEARDVSIKDLLTPERLFEYKRQYWMRGTLAHEDVLYFACRILREYPALRGFLSARFPYLFIDEFQDTLPVQAALVRWLAGEGTIVGVVGDPEQAIYGFLDASVKHFHDFELLGHRTYQIEDNRRSTQSIVSFLNRMRTDGLRQQAIRPEPGVSPVIYFGCLEKSLEHARATSSYATSLLVLARNHDGVRRLRCPASNVNDDPWCKIEVADPERCRFLYHLASAVDLAQRGVYDIAIQRMVQGISSQRRFREPLKYKYTGEVCGVKRPSLAFQLLEFLTSSHDNFSARTVLEVYKELEAKVPSCLHGLKLKAAVRGRFHDIAAACSYASLFHSLRTSEETGLIRTIHQAKGSEAEGVFVMLDDASINHIVNPNAGDEEQRITYVALSRAKEELFIYCPTPNHLQECEALGVTIQVFPDIAASSTQQKRRVKRRSGRPV